MQGARRKALGNFRELQQMQHGITLQPGSRSCCGQRFLSASGIESRRQRSSGCRCDCDSCFAGCRCATGSVSRRSCCASGCRCRCGSGRSARLTVSASETRRPTGSSWTGPRGFASGSGCSCGTGCGCRCSCGATGCGSCWGSASLSAIVSGRATGPAPCPERATCLAPGCGCGTESAPEGRRLLLRLLPPPEAGTAAPCRRGAPSPAPRPALRRPAGPRAGAPAPRPRPWPRRTTRAPSPGAAPGQGAAPAPRSAPARSARRSPTGGRCSRSG